MPESSTASPNDLPAHEPIPELLELGQRLRRAREGRGIGMAELADRLHLAPEQLTALESGDRLHLHEPVFVIAQAKRVAQALGVDVSQQVEDLRQSRLMERPTAGSEGPRAGVGAGVGAEVGPETGEHPRAPWGIAAAVAALTVLLALLLAQAFRQWPTPRLAEPPRPVPGKGKGATPPAPAGPGVLVLRSDEPSWVEVRDNNGQILFSGQLEKEGRFRLGPGLRVLAGRPDLVTASVGSEPPRRLGTISQVAWQDFPPPPAPAAVPETAPVPAQAP
ncbi:MAG: helix-turn-helix domain-containing protein [Synechococcaceae cyanobacterium]|nr:helix-turn-helix domain-containing protein [Synechococcaceae cyanobacterium]